MAAPTVHLTGMPAAAQTAVLVAWDDNAGAWVPLQTDADGKLIAQADVVVESGALAAGENHIGEVGMNMVTVSANFTRVADSNAYDSGDLIANDVDAADVVPLSWTAARVAAGAFMVRNAKVRKSDVTLTNASFRLHLFSAAPSIATTGDNGVFASVVSGAANWLGAFDVSVDTALADDAVGRAAPRNGGEIIVKLGSGQTIYGLLEARAAYGGAAANAEVFTVDLELVRA